MVYLINLTFKEKHMKIALIGPGAMGMLFGGYLSRRNEVILIGHNSDKMRRIDAEGLMIRETDGTENVFRPHAVADSTGMEPVDLVLLFVKSGASKQALDANRHLIGPDTLLLTLQNGAGHESLLRQYTDDVHIIIGTTQQGSYRLSDTAVCHSGKGSTAFGAVSGDSTRFADIADNFTACGFPCEVTDAVKGMIWNKLMINASSSVLSGVLQTAQGFVASDPYAWSIAKKLIREICAVATAEGYVFDADEQIERIRLHLEGAPDGFTSIYADLKCGRVTEAPVISGAVVDAAKRVGVEVPTHEVILELVRALEGRAGD
jgi:2-dehydropantoate 2-reductase